MAVTNYYEKYRIPQSEDLQTIQSIINQKILDEENDTFSGGHGERLEELKDAKFAFKDEQSRESYDKSLRNTEERAASLDDERNAVYEKWFPTVYRFYVEEHFDVAKAAYENAVSGGSPDLENSEVFEFGAKICAGAFEYDEALKYINKAIVGQPDDARYLITKSDILSNFEARAYSDRVYMLIEIEKRTLELAVKIAQKNIDTASLGNAYNNLAFVWHHRSGGDKGKAKIYAEKALAIEQSWSDAKGVLQSIFDERHSGFMPAIERIKAKQEVVESLRQELQNLDKRIAELQQKRRNKINNRRYLISSGVVIAILGILLLPSTGALGAFLLIGGIVIVFAGLRSNSDGVLELSKLNSQRTQYNSDYTKARQECEDSGKSLHAQYTAFCAEFKAESEKYGIKYSNIDYSYLNSSPTAGAAAQSSKSKNGWRCKKCDTQNTATALFCKSCGEQRAK
jgi:tetratricopeptide (TPR) repeat protein